MSIYFGTKIINMTQSMAGIWLKLNFWLVILVVCVLIYSIILLRYRYGYIILPFGGFQCVVFMLTYVLYVY